MAAFEAAFNVRVNAAVLFSKALIHRRIYFWRWEPNCLYSAPDSRVIFSSSPDCEISSTPVISLSLTIRRSTAHFQRSTVVAAINRLMRPDDFSLSVYDQFLKQRNLIWTPSSMLDMQEYSGFYGSAGFGHDGRFGSNTHLRNTQTAKEENRKRGRCANAKITLPMDIDFDFKTGQWSWVEPWASRIKTAFDNETVTTA